jgi:hypothetical protein
MTRVLNKFNENFKKVSHFFYNFDAVNRYSLTKNLETLQNVESGNVLLLKSMTMFKKCQDLREFFVCLKVLSNEN